MKTLIQIALVVFIGYILFSIFSDNKKSQAESEDGRTMLLHGEVTGIFSLFNQTVILVKELETDEMYNVILSKDVAPKIGAIVMLTIQRYDIIKINDRSITLFKEVDTTKKRKPSKKENSDKSKLFANIPTVDPSRL